MADRSLWQGIVSSLWPFGAQREEPLKANERMMRDAQAFVDPSRLFGGKLSTPYNPSVLVTRKGLNVFDQMKVDEQVKAALLFKKHAALAAGWEVVSPGDEDEEWEVTEFVRDVITAVPGGAVRLFRSVLLGLDYGYSITEKVVVESEIGSTAGKLVLGRAVSVKPHYLDFQVDAHGQVLALLQKYVPGQETLEFSPDKFIVYTHDQEFENPYGRSDLEAAYRAWWVKDNAYKWFAVALERYGMPPLFLLYNPNDYQGGQVEELKKVVKNIQNATMGVIPRGSKEGLEFWSAALGGQAKDVFLAALSRFDADIGKALLQPSLTGFSGEGGKGEARGSLARANIHWKAFLYVVEELQRSLATVINEQLVRQLCDLNFPNLQSYPIFRFARLDDELQLELFKTWEALVVGKVVNQITDDETHIRAALGFPENEDPKELKQPEAVAPGAGGGFGKKDRIKGIQDEMVFEISDEMRTFAQEHGGKWQEMDGETVCVGMKREDSDKLEDLPKQLSALQTTIEWLDTVDRAVEQRDTIRQRMERLLLTIEDSVEHKAVAALGEIATRFEGAAERVATMVNEETQDQFSIAQQELRATLVEMVTQVRAAAKRPRAARRDPKTGDWKFDYGKD